VHESLGEIYAKAVFEVNVKQEGEENYARRKEGRALHRKEGQGSLMLSVQEAASWRSQGNNVHLQEPYKEPEEAREAFRGHFMLILHEERGQVTKARQIRLLKDL
jgi:hypothetical protein